jgi:hypothetical protein
MDRRGWIYSRRMISEAKRRLKASEWGKKGGNPSLRKTKENSGEDKGGDKGSLEHGDKPQKPEARSHSVDESTDAHGVVNDPESPDFDPLKALFDDGVRILGAAGTREGQARSLIGRWRKEFGDDTVALALAAAESHRPPISQPLEWLQKWLAARQSHFGQATDKSNDLVEIILAKERRKAVP